MKPLFCLPAICFLSLPVVSLFGQDKKEPPFDFFAKGENSYTLNEKAYYGRMKYISNGQDYNRYTATNFDLDWNHWFGGLGAGLTLNASWSGTHYFGSNTEQKYRTFALTPNVAYGKTLSDKFGVYGRADLTLGWGKDIYSSPTTTTSKYDQLGYGGSIGFPYRFADYTTLTAEVSYDHLRSKFGSASKEEENSFGVNLFLEDYRRCGQLRCDHSTGFKLSKGKYDQGNGFINYETAMGFVSGKNTQTYNTPSYTYKNKFSNFDANFNGSWYIIDNISVGGRLSYNHSLQKSDDNTFRNSWDNFNFDPEVIINAPVDNGWRNLFVKGGGYFGSEKSKVTSIGTTNTDKYGITGFHAGIGYYGFFSEETAVQTCIYYRSTTYNDKNSSDKSVNRGLAVSVGLVHSFGN